MSDTQQFIGCYLFECPNDECWPIQAFGGKKKESLKAISICPAHQKIVSPPNSLQKFHTFLAYWVEFGYDLAIAPLSNVSGSFGFEGFVGSFGQ